MLNLFFMLAALASNLTPVADKAPVQAPPAQTASLPTTFRLLVIPAGEAPDRSMEVREVAQNSADVKLTLDPAFAKAGWSCGVTPVRKSEDEVRRTVLCTQVVGKTKTLAASQAVCPTTEPGRSYTTMNLGVGSTEGKLKAGATFFLMCMTAPEGE
jgi:hypothetical protein